jgi:hypothetical protein
MVTRVEVSSTSAETTWREFMSEIRVVRVPGCGYRVEYRWKLLWKEFWAPCVTDAFVGDPAVFASAEEAIEFAKHVAAGAQPGEVIWANS